MRTSVAMSLLAAVLSIGACEVFGPDDPPPKEPDPTWVQTRPFPEIRSLNDVSMLAAGLGFAVGTDGAVVRIGSGTFDLEDSGTTEDLEGLATATDQEGEPVVLAVGANGTAVLRVAGAWSVIDTGVTVQLFGAYLRNPVDGFIVGDAGTILRFNGAPAGGGAPTITLQVDETLQEIPITGPPPDNAPGIGLFPIGESLKAVAGNGSTVWATGSAGAVYRVNADNPGERWVPEESDTRRPLVSLFAESGLWSATIDGVLVRSGGDSVWNDDFAVPVPVFLQDAWVRGGDDVYTVGMIDSLYHHLGGGVWEAVRLEQDMFFRGIDGTIIPPAEEGDEPGLLIVAVGAGGRIVRGPLVVPTPDDTVLKVDEIEPIAD
jgi:hypothetical protein